MEAFPNGCLKKDLRLADMGESGVMSKELERGELMLADSAASRCLSESGLGGMLYASAVGWCEGVEGRKKDVVTSDLEG